jgi:hypothetical protein
MATTANNKQQVHEPLLVVVDDFKEKFGEGPLFPEKVAKATAIMKLVREKQATVSK